MTNKNSNQIYLAVKDHSVSGETFQLVYNLEYDLLETKPQPSSEKLPGYYKSEDYISHTDSKRNLFEKVYHVVKKRSLKQKLNLINAFAIPHNNNTVSNEKKLLDVGCGTGDFLAIAKRNHWNVFGIEPNKEARHIANTKTNNAVYDINELLRFESHTFDVITLWHVLEHLPNLEQHMAVFKNILKPDGTLIIAVPNYKSYDAKYYKQYWAAFDVPRHLWHFSKTAISKLVSKRSMAVVKVKPMLFDAFYVSLLSEKYKCGKMNPIRGFWIGFVSNLKALWSKEASSLIYIIKND